MRQAAFCLYLTTYRYKSVRTIVIECFDGKIEITIQTDPFETIDEPRNLTSNWNEDFKELPGTDNPYIKFIKTGEIPTNPVEPSHMGVEKTLIVGFFLITMNFSFGKMEDGLLKDMLLTSADIAALILGERKKTAASQGGKQMDDGEEKKATKRPIKIIKEGHKNIVLHLDMNSEEDINELINTIYLNKQKNDKKPPQ
jgi:hypothetical protein